MASCQFYEMIHVGNFQDVDLPPQRASTWVLPPEHSEIRPYTEDVVLFTEIQKGLAAIAVFLLASKVSGASE